MFARLSSFRLLAAAPDRMGNLAILAGFIFAALLVGVVTASGNLMLTGLVVGAVLGVLMLNAVSAVIWIILIGTLFVSGPILLFAPQFTRVTWLFSILGFFLTFAAIIYAGTVRNVELRPAPTFVLIAIGFAVFAISTTFFSDGGFNEGATAIKRNMQFLGLMFAITFVPMKAKAIRSWFGLLMVLALLQVPLALYQRIVLVPLRYNMPNRVVPVDVVAGSFEASMYGGGNSVVMAFFVIVALAAILCAYRERLIAGFWTLLLVCIIAIPLTLGETKIVLVLVPVALFALFIDLAPKRPMLFIIGSMLAALAMAALFYVYIAIQNPDGRTLTFEQRVTENMEYNFGNAGYYDGASLNRSNVVQFWWDKNGSKDPVKTVFGHGLGASFGLPGADAPGHLVIKYPGHGIDLTTMSALLWDVGLFGLLLYLLLFWNAWQYSRRLIKEANPGIDRAMCRTLSASVAMMSLLIIATNVLLFAPSMQVLIMLTFGLLAWRWRHSVRSDG